MVSGHMFEGRRQPNGILDTKSCDKNFAAMQQPDDLVIQLDYANVKGVESRRVVGPFGFCRSTDSSRSVFVVKNRVSSI